MLPIFIILSMPAFADVFVYRDQQDRFTVSFADEWRVVSNQNADDALVVMAPGNDEALCRMRVRDDRRYAIFPHRYRDEAQRIAYGHIFWDDYFTQYNNASIHGVSNYAGLGRGPASYAEAFFTPVGSHTQKQAIAFASLFHNKAYIVECSSATYSFVRWKPHFLNFIKSVDFDETIFPYPSANYRNFMMDRKIEIRGDKKIRSSYY